MITLTGNRTGYLDRIITFFRPENRRTRKILVYGDSNSARDFPGRQPDWPSLLQKRAGSCLEIINQSTDGRTTGLDSGQLNGKEYFKKMIRKYSEVDCVVIMLGTNDFKKEYGNVTAEDSVSNIEDMIKFVKTNYRQIKPVLVTPPPLNPSEAMVEDAPEKVAGVAVLIRQLGERQKVKVVDLGSRIKPARHLAGDGVHLNGAGRKLVSAYLHRQLSLALNQ